MKDTQLYQQLLGLQSPWTVSKVELHVKTQRVDVWAEHNRPRTWPCPECDKACGLHDHEAERSWRHLDSCQFQTHLHARVPRVRCPEHGVRQVRVSWAEPLSRFTLLFERLAIDVLRETDILGAAKILGLSWDEAHHIMAKAVARGLARRPAKVPRILGIDEKAMRKGHKYVTLVNDLEKGHVIEITQDRKKDSLERCFYDFSLDELATVEAVGMDMWEPYIRTVQAFIADGAKKIVFDKFHIVKHANEALDKVRRREVRELRADGDDRLVGTKHWWLYAGENVPEKHRAQFAILRQARLKTARAWSLKETLRDLWSLPTREAAQTFWQRWYGWARRSRLEPFRKLATMVKRHLDNILSYYRHRITNATSEAINSVIQTIKKRAYGFRSFPNFRMAILFHCGGLDLYPTIPHPKAR